MWICGRRMACGAVTGAIAVTLAGCGGSSKSPVPVPKRTTIAEVCKQDRKAKAAVVGGLVDYMTYMKSEDPAFRLTFAKSGIAERVAPAIRALKRSSGPAGSTAPGQLFFGELGRLEGWLKSPPAVPSAVIGDRNASKLDAAARAVGCPL